MAKKSFQTAPKPKTKLSQVDIESFENGGAGHDKNPHKHIPTNVGKKEKLTRLSIDLPESVHLRFKTACSATKRKMTKEIESFILKRCKELEKQR